MPKILIFLKYCLVEKNLLISKEIVKNPTKLTLRISKEPHKTNKYIKTPTILLNINVKDCRKPVQSISIILFFLIINRHQYCIIAKLNFEKVFKLSNTFKNINPKQQKCTLE